MYAKRFEYLDVAVRMNPPDGVLAAILSEQTFHEMVLIDDVANDVLNGGEGLVFALNPAQLLLQAYDCRLFVGCHPEILAGFRPRRCG